VVRAYSRELGSGSDFRDSLQVLKLSKWLMNRPPNPRCCRTPYSHHGLAHKFPRTHRKPPNQP